MLQSQRIHLHIYYHGATLQEMIGWLGNKYSLYRQHGDNLGQRMARAFDRSMQLGAHRTILFGADCPELSSQIITSGLKKLHHHDLILGPAVDGGYYLIGLRSRA
jgi:glycosyltransferase A (GT-A) superfamily protein (DUF2064 family)